MSEIVYSDRVLIENAYIKWIKSYPEIPVSPSSLIAFLSMRDLLKDRLETPFYTRQEAHEYLDLDGKRPEHISPQRWEYLKTLFEKLYKENKGAISI